jgi:Single-strand binding protein family
MYLNTATLTGFLGGDAETRTTKSNTTFTVFSLATKDSWKDRETGEWTSRTEWPSRRRIRPPDGVRRCPQERRSRSDPGPTADS